MSRKKRNAKKQTKRNPHTRAAQRSPAGATAAAVQLDPELAVSSILEAIAPALFETAPEIQDRASGTYDTRPAISPHDEHDSGTFESESSPPFSEHRVSPRVALAIEIGLVSDSHFFCGLSGDVSEGGVFVQTYRELPVGREVDLDFDLPGGHVTAHGKVCWHRSPSEMAPPGVGITFDELPDDARSIIHDFCQAREPLYYDVDLA